MMTPDAMPSPAATAAAMTDEDFQQLEALLDDLGTRAPDIPTSWEYCDGFMAALLCCRRLIMPSEYFPVLFGAPDGGPGFGHAHFRDEAQRQTFLDLWMRRWNEIATALQAPVETLDDERTFHPYLVDVRGMVAAATDEERQALVEALEDGPLPSFAQYWAVGFMDAVQAWADDWRAPRERELAREWEEALLTIAALMEDDDEPAAINPVSDDAPPSVSAARLELFGEAIWAVYTLHDIARELGPPIATVRKAAEPGRNDPCPCGSGKKYKKCCGAAA
ncbi:yecA family protein [Tepidimonas thermarum]|uniref:YecA family protein n=1 Tax=Tepidimonas thermarum TaxID=335431 RepID=A0A554X495_9BURK|nr:UPF0149 family protein [Tepidimonas thermarum]TSE30623.1 yecA family protein [Tepidimonas thermarum]